MIVVLLVEGETRTQIWPGVREDLLNAFNAWLEARGATLSELAGPKPDEPRELAREALYTLREAAKPWLESRAAAPAWGELSVAEQTARGAENERVLMSAVRALVLLDETLHVATEPR